MVVRPSPTAYPPSQLKSSQVEGIIVIPKFDIFKGGRDEGAYWIDAVTEEVYQTMLLLAAAKPGRYFIFDRSEDNCVGAIDTTATATV
jgi:hypothetical protein